MLWLSSICIKVRLLKELLLSHIPIPLVLLEYFHKIVIQKYHQKSLLDEITYVLIDRIAEFIKFGKDGMIMGAINNLEKSTKIAIDIVKKYDMFNVGMRNFNVKSYCPLTSQEKIDNKIESIIIKTISYNR